MAGFGCIFLSRYLFTDFTTREPRVRIFSQNPNCTYRKLVIYQPPSRTCPLPTRTSYTVGPSLAANFCLLLFVSLLSHFWLIHFFPPTTALSTISRPLSSSMCSITPETANVGSSYNRMRGPGIGCWFSDRSNCSHWSLTLTFKLTSENLMTVQELQVATDQGTVSI